MRQKPKRKPAGKSPRGKQILFGLHPCLEAIKNPKRQGHRLFITKKAYAGLAHDHQKRIDNILAPIFVEGSELEGRLNPGDVHQGILLEVDPLASLSLEDIAEAATDSATIVLLDQVTDPHNVGAILRSAAVFGASAVVMPQHHSADMTATLAKCASGALEYVPMVVVGNLKQSMDYLKAQGFWCVGLDERGEKDTQEFAFEGKTALVLGAEGKGLRRLTQETCDLLVRLPTGDHFQTLNVSNAAAVALYEIFCQSTSRRKST